jgi:hypothetical protein
VSQAARPIPGEAIREELERVLLSHEFRASKRSQDFLRYVVDHTIDGDTEQLKERTIGMEVFGRPASYDPSEDATVRVKAGEVRKRLGLYYAGEGARSRVRIELPSGTYVPEFHWHNGAAYLSGSERAEAPGRTAVPVSSTSWSRRALRYGGGAVILAATLVGMYVLKPQILRNSPLDQFWAPVLQGTTPISICAAYVPVFALNHEPALKRTPEASDFVHLTDQFVGGGDLIAVSRLAALLTRVRRPFRVRVDDAVSFSDLRTSPTILVGYSYTHWREISSEMRYFIDTSHAPVGITDNGAATPWTLPNLPADRRTSEDYALVTRVFHPDTHAMLVELAGITQYGTDAAAEFVTSPELLQEALRSATPDWPRKNLQFVLHVKVLSGVPAVPKVVATHVW